METRSTARSDDDDRCRVPHTENDRADVPFSIDLDPESEADEEDGYGFGV